MSIVSAASPIDPFTGSWGSKGVPRLAKQLYNASQFFRGLRVQMRFGELTRAPLKLLRFQVLGETAECDWLARSPDPWDTDLPQNIRERHSSLQTLRDAIDVRALLFDSLPHVDTAALRVYRDSPRFIRELVLKGYVQRNDNSSRGVHSLAMRAKILGFRFNLEGHILRGIPMEQWDSICE